MKAPKTYSSLSRLMAFTGLAASLVLSGCGGSSNSSSLKPVTELSNAGVVASVSSDFSSGGVNVINLDSENYDMTGPYHETGSDIAVVGGTGHYYILGKYQMDNISKVELSNPAKKTWDEFSVIAPGETNSGNPYDLIRVNDQKAYLLRYDSDKILIVNPSATNEADFYTGNTLDLSSYTPADNKGDVPHASAATLVDDKLFVTLQRLNDSYEPVNTSYVAVFDSLKDEEIDTGKGEDGLKGIRLLGTNPDDIQYHEDFGLVVRNLGTNNQTYGKGTSLDIIKIKENYAISDMIPATTSGTQGQLLDVVIVDKTRGYLINLSGYGKASVQSFNPASGRSSFTTVGHLDEDDFRDIELSPKGNLWVADANEGNPGIRIINTDDNQELTFVESLEGLLPNNIAFVTE